MDRRTMGGSKRVCVGAWVISSWWACVSRSVREQAFVIPSYYAIVKSIIAPMPSKTIKTSPVWSSGSKLPCGWEVSGSAALPGCYRPLTGVERGVVSALVSPVIMFLPLAYGKGWIDGLDNTRPYNDMSWTDMTLTSVRWARQMLGHIASHSEAE